MIFVVVVVVVAPIRIPQTKRAWAGAARSIVVDTIKVLFVLVLANSDNDNDNNMADDDGVIILPAAGTAPTQRVPWYRAPAVAPATVVANMLWLWLATKHDFMASYKAN